jgi:hypothetical protein
MLGNTEQQRASGVYGYLIGIGKLVSIIDMRKKT